jgi:hypothetical protein
MNDPRDITTLGSLIVEAFGVNDERALREEVAERSEDAGWDEMPLDARAAMASLVRQGLLRLADDVEEWLPAAAVALSDQSFGFFVWWKNRHLDEEIIEQRARSEHDAQERLSDLRRIAGRQRDREGS